ncbi:MAG: dihydrofolate reductase family protein [Actinomycetota bacterium]
MIELLWEEHGLPQQPLPDVLRELYGGPLGFEGPRVFANFVQTVDGVVAIPELEQSNALVADHSRADKFLMGLLRALADVVVVGSGTLLSSPAGMWRPAGVFPDAADAFAELGEPALAVVSTGASLDVGHPALQRAVVLTTVAGAALLDGVLPDVVAVNDGDWVDVSAGLRVLRERGHARILSEAGPHVFGSLLADGCVDELFLTISPVVAGRFVDRKRFSLVEGVELLPQVHVDGRVVSVRRAENHLFLRYVLR